MNAKKHAHLLRVVVLSSSIVASLTLTACGGGNDSSQPSQIPSNTQSDGDSAKPMEFAATDYMPLSVGTRWVRSLMDDNNEALDIWAHTAIKSLTLAGQNGFVVQERPLVFSPTSLFNDDYYTNDAQGLVFSAAPADSSAVRPDSFQLLPAKFKVGDEVKLPDSRLTRTSSDEAGEPFTITSVTATKMVVDGVEDIQTYAGEFKNCIRVKIYATTQSTTTATKNHATTTTSSSKLTTTWYAPGVGDVRTQNEWTDESGSKTHDRNDLLAYEVNGKRNETVHPTATITNNPTQANHWQFKNVVVEFNELMDPDSLAADANRNAGAFQLVTALGQQIPLKVTTTSYKSVTVTPAIPLSVSGTYQLTLTQQAKDLAGNTANPTSWTFFVDGTPPAPAKVTPAPGASNVAINQKFVIELSEDIEPPTFLEAAFAVKTTDGTYNTNVPATVQVVGREIRVTPDVQLQPASSYKLYLRGNDIVDLAGNAWNISNTPYQQSFTTAP